MPTDLSPRSETSAVILPSSGAAGASSEQLRASAGEVLIQACPFGIYTGSADFLTGASHQVSYVYKKLGGDVVDIELTVDNVYAAYEEAVLEYSYIINLHQSKNSLSSMLGQTTGTFDYQGQMKTAVSGAGTTQIALRYPKFQLASAKKIGDGMASVAGFGGTVREYSASFSPSTDQQDYDLQKIIEDASASGQDDGGNAIDFSGKVNSNQRVMITKVYFMSPRAMWRFYGYYGGVGVVGNYSTYGQFADDSTFEIIPTWQNKMQAIMYEDSIYTRTSHYSYELINNRLRLYPTPSYWSMQLDRIWFRFYVEDDVWKEPDGYHDGTLGVNNMNTLPFENLRYENINSIGKQWIRKYALALCKEMLGQIRGKFTTIPIPGESVTLNHSELLTQAKEEQTQLKEKLMEMLKEMEYTELAKNDTERADAAAATFKNSPLPIFVG
tara:strand:- start:1567 stop:2889 length:1323 start_codon:yes stop_codon:yes gene_type:complete